MGEKKKAIGIDQFVEFGAAVLRALPRDIPPEVAQRWIEDQESLAFELAEFLCPGLIVARIEAELCKPPDPHKCFVRIPDGRLPRRFWGPLPAWRGLARHLGYEGPVAWLVRRGFTLKQHAPKSGPCFENFAYLQDQELRNDEPTKNSIVFWIPRILPNSDERSVDVQKALLADLRQRYDLPATHLASFGSASLLAGLILAHFKLTGERVPLDHRWVRTDTLYYPDGYRLRLGNFGEHGLICGHWGEDHGSDLGCFALGAELLGQ